MFIQGWRLFSCLQMSQGLRQPPFPYSHHSRETFTHSSMSAEISGWLRITYKWRTKDPNWCLQIFPYLSTPYWMPLKDFHFLFIGISGCFYLFCHLNQIHPRWTSPSETNLDTQMSECRSKFAEFWWIFTLKTFSHQDYCNLLSVGISCAGPKWMRGGT